MNTSMEASIGREAHVSALPLNIYRTLVLRTLGNFSKGHLRLQLPGGEALSFGDCHAPITAEIRILRDSFFRKCALSGGVGLGESYVDGDWDTNDIKNVIKWFIVNLHADDRLRGSSQRFRFIGLLKLVDRVGHRLRHNSLITSRRNIEEHYDLGNDFYRLWLDPSMTYSSARFSSSAQTLEQAQSAKYDALCEKLQLREGDHVLEIGCGWGGFSMHAATRYGCRVTAVTISNAQYDEASKRVREAGMEHLIDIRLQDYRGITGTYDKIASIEMLEAVGDKYHETWASKCHQVLRPNGLLAVQMITVPDSDYAELRRGTDFIQKHIFPGSLLLSVGRMNNVLGKAGKLFLHNLEDLGQSYARTLKIWHSNFNTRLDNVRELGYSEAFIRKWNYYLKYCEAAFETRNISVVQAVYTRPCNTKLRESR